jgi:hypothetical protein
MPPEVKPTRLASNNQKPLLIDGAASITKTNGLSHAHDLDYFHDAFAAKRFSGGGG